MSLLSLRGDDTENSKTIRSVGIDISSTTIQIVFSKLKLGYIKGTNKLEVLDREITYLSDVFMTLFKGCAHICEDIFISLSSYSPQITQV
jgi:ethanolamine utilization protein EutA (predicted chaperonin)